MAPISEASLLQLAAFIIMFLNTSVHFTMRNNNRALVARRSRISRFIRNMQTQARIFTRQRRRARLVMLTSLSLLYHSSRIVDPDLHRIPRDHMWFEQVVIPHFTDREWLRNFRMKKATFESLCDLLRPGFPDRNETRKPISVEKRVAITVWRLATPCEFRTIGHLFGVARSTACKIVHEVVGLIIERVFPEYVKWPRGAQLMNVLRGFEIYRGMPQCAGAIDGTHIHVMPPEEVQADYLNRKGFHSINLQAVCDHRLRFTDIYVGWAGRAHDARVFRNSTLFLNGEEHALFPLWTKEIEGIHIPIFIVGDPAYPLLEWLMKGYMENAQITPEQRRFNFLLSSARMIIEMAFGQLKGRWRCIGKKNESDIAFIPAIVTACCALHNFCIEHGDLFDRRYLDLPAEFAQFEDPVQRLDIHHGVPWNPEDADVELPSGRDIRNALTTYLNGV